MLRLLSLSLTNIGPFRDQTRTVDFRPGSFLVKAPIGSGKSFLYFDGPTFALYKKNKLKNGRDMLNIHSKTGQIVCSFEIEWQTYMIQRDFTKTKTGESVKSKLFISKEVWQVVSQRSTSSLLNSSTSELIEFKNESDLQQMLNSLLPPFEVFLSTQMLMQDSENIFELDAKDRLEVFKNVFGLLGIDDAKDRITERKREISAMIKARADTSQYDEKVKQLIWQLITQRSALYEMAQDHISSPERIQTIQERSLLQDKITIDNLSLPQRPNFWPLLQYIEKQHHEFISLQTQQTSVQQQCNNLQRDHQSLQRQQLESQQLLSSLQGQLASYDPKQIEQISEQINNLQEEINTINISLSQEKVSETIKNLKWSGISLFDDLIKDATRLFLDNDKQRSITIVQSLISQLTTIGKDCKYQMELAQQAQQHQTQQIAQFQEQLNQANNRIASFQQDIEQQRIFHCDKIQWSCPYIDMINTVTFRKLDEQLQSFIRERDSLQTKVNQLTSPILPDAQTSQPLNFSTIIDLIGSSLTNLERKQIEQQVQQLTTLQQSLSRFQQQRQTLHTQWQKIQSLQDQSTMLQATIASVAHQAQSLDTQINELTTQYTQINNQLTTLPGQHIISKQREQIAQYDTSLDRLAQIISDYKASQLEIKQLKEDEKVLTDLYQIFARELLLIVVQKNLPLLQDLMNSYLSQVVDYQLQMEIDKKSATNDNIELFVTVIDERGPREVKSLSGGQKVILKIVWMMAVANLTRSQMLFLDETINNLDGDTVGKVAELLKNFIEGRGKDFMLTVVTHSHQIQEMSIWDEVIEIGKLL